MNWHPHDEVRSSGWSRIPERQTMTLEELRTLPDGAIVVAGGNVYQKHDGRFKAWFCVDGHTPERMLNPDVVRQPVEVVHADLRTGS